jgi:hypothetical protein
MAMSVTLLQCTFYAPAGILMAMHSAPCKRCAGLLNCLGSARAKADRKKSLPLIVFGAMALPSRREPAELAARVGVGIAKILFVPESVDSRRT